MDDDFALLKVIASASRHRILDLLAKGVDHPEDLADRLGLRRQSVDKHLLELYGWGFIDRSAIFPADGRPRIVYRLSDRGKEFVGQVDTLVQDYHQGVVSDYQRNLDFLEGKLASGEVDEGVYRKQRRTLEARYRRFLEG